MMHDHISNEYFEWLYNLVCCDRYADDISYRELLIFLHTKPFRYSITRDENRLEDGLELRHQFAYECAEFEDAETYIVGPCSVLEMMVALAIRCERNIMDDPSIGDRTAQWFWEMVINLGLGYMDDSKFNKRTANNIIERFLDRDYEPDGKGGLFRVRDCDVDLRTVEIWHQLCWYLDSIT